MTAKNTIARLIERARRGEELELHHPYDIEVFACFEEIYDHWQQGQTLREDQIEFLMEFALASPLPKNIGRLPNQQLKDEKAAAISWGADIPPAVAG
jgi:hypothetical protein